ncbi:hypothetical protein KC992_04370 [Candidatus Saccharibacteria bacterium]|nr:hypothetical protein [Candidatus Saccharibacteria bacterium]
MLRIFIKRVAVSAIVPAFALASTAPAMAHRSTPTVEELAGPTEETVLVLPGDMATSFVDVLAEPSSWFFYNDENDTIDNTLGAFVDGPDTPPAGAASVEIAVTGTQRRNLATYQFSGVKLADITELKFSTFNASATNPGNVNRSGYLNFNVDFDGSDNWQKRLAYVPSVNGTVSQDSWQEWNASDDNAMWCWSGMTGCGGAATNWPAQTGTPFVDDNQQYQKWSDIIAAYPDIAVRTTDSWMGVRVGEPYADGYTENVDKFVFGTADKITTFDFEKVYPVSGEIVKPTDGQHVKEWLKLKATYDDGDTENDDAVQWAVRQGTCAAGTNTVLGNVDGHNDSYKWDGATFKARLDIRGLEEGEYCFVFNPTDDPGQVNVRETRNFYVEAFVPERIKDCFWGGWRDYVNPSFRNQGQCVKYVLENMEKPRHHKQHHFGGWCWGWWR